MCRTYFFSLLALVFLTMSYASAKAQTTLIAQSQPHAEDVHSNFPNHVVKQEITENTKAPIAEQDVVARSEYDDKEFVPSYGNESPSLFFAPKAFSNYLKVITLFEKNGSSVSSNVNPADIEDKSLRDVLQRIDSEKPQKLEPIIYPYYHLGSILFHAKRDWAVTINGIIITNRNNKSTNELYVTSVQPNRATFIWHPQDKRLMNDLKLHARDASSKRDKALDHRRVKHSFGQPMVNADGAISFSLEPNQLFHSNYLTIYEGGLSGIVPSTPSQNNSAVAQTSPDGTVPAAVPSEIVSQIKALQSQSNPATALNGVTIQPKVRNALNSFSSPDEVVVVPTPATSAPIAPDARRALNAPIAPVAPIAPAAPMAAPTVANGVAPFAQPLVPAASTLAPAPVIVSPIQTVVPGSVGIMQQNKSNQMPLKDLPSIDTIAP